MSEQSQAITVEFDVAATMRDGTVLRANVYRPTEEGRWPVLLTRLPYGKDLSATFSGIDPAQAARRGFVVVVQDTRGRFRSEGEWYPFRNETEDGVDSIAWAAALPYADGQVGMFGASYFGFTQWSAATRQPAALKAMVPFITWADPFNGLTHRGGAFELGLAASWQLSLGFDILVRRHRNEPASLHEAVRALGQEIDDRSINLTDGIIRARYRDAGSGKPPSLIEPGRPYEYVIDLWATSNRFKAGHRIGLQVTSSNFPRWDRNPNTGHAFGADAELRVANQEIRHDRAHPSYILLPIVAT